MLPDINWEKGTKKRGNVSHDSPNTIIDPMEFEILKRRVDYPWRKSIEINQQNYYIYE